MSNFNCPTCNVAITEGEGGRYVTGCEHYPLESGDPICANCGESLFRHRELDFSGLWREGDTCEEFEKNRQRIRITVNRVGVVE